MRRCGENPWSFSPVDVGGRVDGGFAPAVAEKKIEMTVKIQVGRLDGRRGQSGEGCAFCGAESIFRTPENLRCRRRAPAASLVGENEINPAVVIEIRGGQSLARIRRKLNRVLGIESPGRSEKHDAVGTAGGDQVVDPVAVEIPGQQGAHAVVYPPSRLHSCIEMEVLAIEHLTPFRSESSLAVSPIDETVMDLAVVVGECQVRRAVAVEVSNGRVLRRIAGDRTPAVVTESGDASPVNVRLQMQPKPQGFAKLIPPVGDDQVGEAVSVQVVRCHAPGAIGGKLRVIAETVSRGSSPVNVHVLVRPVIVHEIGDDDVRKPIKIQVRNQTPATSLGGEPGDPGGGIVQILQDGETGLEAPTSRASATGNLRDLPNR